MSAGETEARPGKAKQKQADMTAVLFREYLQRQNRELRAAGVPQADIDALTEPLLQDVERMLEAGRTIFSESADSFGL